jgi:hypothetical protein
MYIIIIMEPNLVNQKTLKRILNKNNIRRVITRDYFNPNKNESSLNKFVIESVNKIKVNWMPIIVILFIGFILVFLYKEHQNNMKKKQENMEVEKEMEIINTKSIDIDDEFKSKSNYESEYYKLLPRVTNNPDIQEYKY